MYRTFEEEVFLAPEAIISGVLFADAASDEFDDAVFDIAADLDGTEAADLAAALAASRPDSGAGHDDAEALQAWAGRAAAASGFGGI